MIMLIKFGIFSLEMDWSCEVLITLLKHFSVPLKPFKNAHSTCLGTFNIAKSWVKEMQLSAEFFIITISKGLDQHWEV